MIERTYDEVSLSEVQVEFYTQKLKDTIRRNHLMNNHGITMVNSINSLISTNFRILNENSSILIVFNLHSKMNSLTGDISLKLHRLRQTKGS